MSYNHWLLRCHCSHIFLLNKLQFFMWVRSWFSPLIKENKIFFKINKDPPNNDYLMLLTLICTCSSPLRKTNCALIDKLVLCWAMPNIRIATHFLFLKHSFFLLFFHEIWMLFLVFFTFWRDPSCQTRSFFSGMWFLNIGILFSAIYFKVVYIFVFAVISHDSVSWIWNYSCVD